MKNGYIEPLIDSFRRNTDPEKAPAMRKYMKGRFDYFGIKAPLRKELTKKFISEFGVPCFEGIKPVVLDLFEQPQRELHYAAIELCGRTKRDWDEKSLGHFEKMVVTKSWWDSVDSIKSECIKPYFLRFNDSTWEITGRWIESGNIWLQRLSIIFQLGFKKKTDLKLLERNISALSDSKEFFVQKAIGWALRDYGHFDPEWVVGFVSKHDLASLSRREALKKISV